MLGQPDFNFERARCLYYILRMATHTQTSNGAGPPAAASLPSRKPPDDLSRWLAAQYVAGVGLADLEGGATFKRFTAAFPVPSEVAGPYHITGRARLANFLQLRLGYPLGTDGYTCLTAAAAVGEAAPAHYAYLYWRRGAEAGPPEYVCVAPTLDSRDGEYRPRFTRAAVFLAEYARAAELLAPYEEQVLAMLADGRLHISTTVYPDESSAAARRVAERLPVTTLAAALLLDLWETGQKLIAVHTSRRYVELMDAFAAAAPKLAARAAAQDPAALRVARWFTRGSSDRMRVQCGQKLVPMFEREAAQPYDYSLGAWRELLVTRAVGDLVVNWVAPGFALYNEWTYVEDADAGLFENPAMAERYERGRRAAATVDALRAARRGLHAGADPNYHTEMLSARVYDCLEYAQSFLAVSPVAMLHTMEHVGVALRSFGMQVRRQLTQWPEFAGLFAERAGAARVLFEWAYGAHCLHTKLGVAHADLHGNNLTVYRWGHAEAAATADGEPPEGAAPFYGDPVAAYVAGPRGEADTYVFPAAGIAGCIIDYSRAIVGPGFRPRLEAAGAGRGHPHAAANFYRDQVGRVLRTLHRYAPEYTRANQDALRAAALADFGRLFPALCAIDFLAIGESAAVYLLEETVAVDEHGLRPFRVAQEAVALARQLEEAGRAALVEGLHRALRGRDGPSIEFPGAAILARVFGEWRFPEWAAREPKRVRAMQLVDAYNYTNELRYSGADYERFPPWARLDELERHLGEHKFADLFGRGPEPFLESLQPSARVDVVAERARAAAERLDNPPDVGSSWIAD